MNDEKKPTAKVDQSLVSVARLTDLVRHDPQFQEVGSLYRQDPAFNVQALIQELVESESVPFLPVLRYKESGLIKRNVWERTWDLQRQEDAIDAQTKLPKDDPNYLDIVQAKQLKQDTIGDIPVPPKYATADFQETTYWRMRGKLDVPKERWVTFPGCEGPDQTPVMAWAGYNHLQLARAISAYYVYIQQEVGGQDDLRLVPLLAALIELLPWLKQWHNEVDPEFNLRMGDYFEGFVQNEVQQMGKTIEAIRAWAPQQQPRTRRGRTTR